MTLPCLQTLLKISNHLELMKPDPHDPPQKQEKDRAFAAMALGEDAHLIGGTEAEASFMGLSDPQHCGKMKALECLLEDWKMQGDKVRYKPCISSIWVGKFLQVGPALKLGQYRWGSATCNTTALEYVLEDWRMQGDKECFHCVLCIRTDNLV